MVEKWISYFYAVGYRNGRIEAVRSNNPHELEHIAYEWFDDSEAEYFVAFSDGTEEQYKL